METLFIVIAVLAGVACVIMAGVGYFFSVIGDEEAFINTLTWAKSFGTIAVVSLIMFSVTNT